MSRVSRFSRPKRTVLPYGSRLDVIFWHSYAIGSRQFLVMLGSAMDVADASRSGANLQGSYTDPCRIRSSSSARLALMATLFISMIVGGVPLFFVLAKRPYGFQTASAIVYTLYVVFFTFARTGTKGGKTGHPTCLPAPSSSLSFRACFGDTSVFLLPSSPFRLLHSPCVHAYRTGGTSGPAAMEVECHHLKVASCCCV